jgi:hypothetical protein
MLLISLVVETGGRQETFPTIKERIGQQVGGDHASGS